MFHDLILPDTRPCEWAEIRARIRARILDSFGTAPIPVEPVRTPFEITGEYTRFGLRHLVIRYHVLEDFWNEAILVLPEDISTPVSAVLTLHGTNPIGKASLMELEKRPRRAYPIELAKRGLATISPDQYGFGSTVAGTTGTALTEEFYRRWPDWSIVAIRVLANLRAADVLDQLDYIRHDGYGAMGNSTGGQSTLFLAAMDERITASVPSCGISPNLTNVYRYIKKGRDGDPALADLIEKDGRMPWDLQEMIALIAPRAMLALEPFNDPYNPYTEATACCVMKAAKVWGLLGAQEKIALHLHGDGHDTIDDVRNLAYDWLERFLK
jgi:dienelactone hydrolase